MIRQVSSEKIDTAMALGFSKRVKDMESRKRKIAKLIHKQQSKTDKYEKMNKASKKLFDKRQEELQKLVERYDRDAAYLEKMFNDREQIKRELFSQ